MSGQIAGPAPERSPDRGRRASFQGLPFVWAAIAAGAVGGFALGGTLALMLALGMPLGAWWPAAIQAHGRAQLVGWGGLMVLGIGLHLLPRIRGVSLARGGREPWVLGLVGIGLALRVVGQPLAAAPNAPPILVWLALVLAGALMLAGVGLALSMLVATDRAGPPVAQQPAFRQVRPLLATGLFALLLSLVLEVGLGIGAAVRESPLLPAAGNSAVLVLQLQGFLLPICLAFSARFLPLYLGLRPASPLALRLALLLLVLGLAGRIAGPAFATAGSVMTGLALLAGLWAVGQRVDAPPGTPPSTSPPEWAPTGLFRPQPPPAGRARSLPSGQRAARMLIRCAYGWLVLAAALALGQATGWPPPLDLERHALGAGFVTLLILGVGGLILPGLLGGSAPDAPLVAALVLGNLAVALRVLPGLVNWAAPGSLPATAMTVSPALGGLAGVAAVACLALIVRAASRRG